MIALLTLIALICWGLNRNHRKVIRTTVNGIPDRDLERLVADLRAIGGPVHERLVNKGYGPD